MPPERIPEPWDSFLSEVDAGLSEEVEFHCLGGFVVTVVYGFERPTADVDVLAVVPRGGVERLIGLAGKGSALRCKHGLYLNLVTVATMLEDYEQRLVEVAAGAFTWLRLFALDTYVLTLAQQGTNVIPTVCFSPKSLPGRPATVFFSPPPGRLRSTSVRRPSNPGSYFSD